MMEAQREEFHYVLRLVGIAHILKHMKVQMVKVWIQQTSCETNRGGDRVCLGPRAFRLKAGTVKTQNQSKNFARGEATDENNSYEKARVQIGPEYRRKRKQSQ